MTSDILVTVEELVGRGVDVSEVFHVPARCSDPKPTSRAPNRTSYASYATFEDPDGNGWTLQEVTTRLPGRGPTTSRRKGHVG